MPKKVKVAIFDEDLVCRKVGKYEVTDGDQIKIKNKGGKGHFMPHFDINCGLDVPSRSPFMPWKTNWDKLYVVQKGAKHCVNFKPNAVICPKCNNVIQPKPENKGPDPSLVEDMANKIMVDRLNDQKQQTPIVNYVIVILLILILAMVSGVIRT